MFPHPPFPPRRHPAFSLVELLVAICIVAVLALLLLPAAGSLQSRTAKARCASNLRQIVTATTQYAGENDGQYPVLGWTGGGSPHRIEKVAYEEKFESYLGKRNAIMFCPGPLKKVRNPDISPSYQDRFVTYQYALMPLWNQENAPKRIGGSLAHIPVWGCLTFTSGGLSYGHSNPATTKPIEGMNVAYLDGSVAWVNRADLTTWGNDGGSEFLWPKP